jgi:hypothetical protein
MDVRYIKCACKVGDKSSFIRVKDEDNEQWPDDMSSSPLYIYIYIYIQNGAVLGLN